MSDILKKDYNIKNDNKKYSHNDRKKLSTRIKEIKSKMGGIMNIPTGFKLPF